MQTIKELLDLAFARREKLLDAAAWARCAAYSWEKE